jgi:hypothetical protein
MGVFVRQSGIWVPAFVGGEAPPGLDVPVWHADDQKTAFQATASTITVDAPGNIAEGDLLVCCIMSQNSGADAAIWPTRPAGWSSVIQEHDTAQTTAPGAAWFTKVATDDEPADYTWSRSNSVQRARAVVGRVTGAGVVDDSSGANSSLTTVDELELGSVDAVGASLLLAAWIADTAGAQTFTVPESMSVLYAAGSDRPRMVVAEEEVADGATGPRECSFSDTRTASGAMIVISGV